jgi:hypothetical protein
MVESETGCARKPREPALFEAQERVATILEQTLWQKQHRENRAVVLTR